MAPLSFIWPVGLALLILIPVGVLAYRRVNERRLRRLAAYSGLGIGVTAAAASHVGWRRRVSAGLVVLGLAFLAVALARPQAAVSTPKLESTIILAFDVSGSMAATDLAPTRMEAAKAAARTFVTNAPPTADIGVIAFSDGGLSVQQPSTDQAKALAAIDRLGPTRGTSVGQGILVALRTIAAQKEGVDYYTNRSPAAPTPEPTPVPQGTHDSAVIVLLTDGENNQSPDPLEAAQEARDRGVRIFTVGIGTPAGTTLQVNGFTVHTQLNEPELQQIADMTDAAYFRAENAQDLSTIYDRLSSDLVLEPEMMEITPIVAGASLLVLLLGGALSLLWFGRMP